MNALKKHFDRIVVISLADRSDRRERLLTNLTTCGLATPEDITWFDAVDGRKETIPDWWESGPGAWGCRFSQLRVIEQAQRNGLGNVLIIEDDAVFHTRTAEWLDETLPLLPADWAQFFLGGQHMSPPKKTAHPKLIKGKCITRTHAYAVNASAYQAIIDEISDDEKFRKYPGSHVDHHFGRCQYHEVWDAYAPSWWMAGQEEGQSNIAASSFSRRWWQEGNYYWKLPFIQTDQHTLSHSSDKLYISPTPIPKNIGELAKWIRRTAIEAWLQCRLPTWHNSSLSPQEIKRLWPAGVTQCTSAHELTALVDYPANGLFSHPFISKQSQPNTIN